MRNPELQCRTHKRPYRWIEIRQIHHALLRAIGIFETYPVLLQHFGETTPRDGQGICPVVPYIARVALYMFYLNWLTGSLPSFE